MGKDYFYDPGAAVHLILALVRNQRKNCRLFLGYAPGESGGISIKNKVVVYIIVRCRYRHRLVFFWLLLQKRWNADGLLLPGWNQNGR
jgi:hypothetical protein